MRRGNCVQNGGNGLPELEPLRANNVASDLTANTRPERLRGCHFAIEHDVRRNSGIVEDANVLGQTDREKAGVHRRQRRRRARTPASSMTSSHSPNRRASNCSSRPGWPDATDQDRTHAPVGRVSRESPVRRNPRVRNAGSPDATPRAATAGPHERGAAPTECVQAGSRVGGEEAERDDAFRHEPAIIAVLTRNKQS